MSKRNTTTETRVVRADSLRIHPTAQRQLVPATVRKIRAKLDLDGIGVLHAVEYDIDGATGPWVIDGQHRLAALMEEGLGEWMVKVEVHTDVKDDARASSLFLVLNTKASVHPFDKYLNELKKGDEAAVAVHAITQKHKVRVERGSGDGTLACVSALKATYSRDEGAALDKTIATVTTAWGRKASALEGKIIEGVGIVFGQYNGQIDQPAMVKKLAKYPGGASSLLGNAKSLREVRKMSTSRAVASLVVDLYNKGRRGGQLDPI